jgi:hypothetical protein
MNKIKINYFVDVLLIISFLVVTITSVVLFLFLQNKIGHIGSQILFGLPKLKWINLHVVSGFAMIVLSFVHLILHFKWLTTMSQNIFKK